MAAPRKREQTATEQIEALERRVFENGGYLIPRPPLRKVEEFSAWLKATAEIGSPGHVELAWHYVSNKLWKDRLRAPMLPDWPGYEALLNEAGARWTVLQKAASEEHRQAAVEHEQRTKIADRNREIEETEARLAALRAS